MMMNKPAITENEVDRELVKALVKFKRPGAPAGNRNALKGVDRLERRTIRLTDDQWTAIQKAAAAAGIKPNALIQAWADSLE